MSTEHTGPVTNFTPGVASRPLHQPGRSNELDRDAFLRLLMIQLQHQDPLNPMEDREFIAQMAQFSALEQMQNMNSSHARSQAYEMIGRDVAGQAFDEGTNTFEWVEGVVTGVSFRGGNPYLEVTDDYGRVRDLALTRVEFVGEDLSLRVMRNINTNIANQQYLAMIGQYVQAVTVNERGDPDGYVEGKVSSVRFGANGQTMLVIGNREVRPQEVVSVGESGNILGRNITAFVFNHNTGGTDRHVGIIHDIRISGNDMSVTMLTSNNDFITVPFQPLDGLVNALEMRERGAFVSGSTGTAANDDTQILSGFVTGVALRAGQIYLLLDEGDRMLRLSNAREGAPPPPEADNGYANGNGNTQNNA